MECIQMIYMYNTVCVNIQLALDLNQSDNVYK